MMVEAPHYIGKYHAFARDWSRTGEFAEAPTYPGQQPIRFPLDWSNLRCAVVANGERR